MLRPVDNASNDLGLGVPDFLEWYMARAPA